jgi:catechol 2,3-dioxygenase-like lactoylglutathione lyase family enzyme
MALANLAARTLACALAISPALSQAQDLLIRNATVHTVTERGTLERSDVLVRNGRIAAVGSNLGAAGAVVVEANGRPLTPGLFGGITALGVEEISQEPTTVDNTPPPAGTAGVPAESRPELDVTLAFNPESAVIGVNRVEGLTYAMVAPGSIPDAAVIAGQGAVVRLDGRGDAVLAPSRTLFVSLGAGPAGAGVSRAAQLMLLEQAAREARPTPQMRDSDFRLLTPTGREVLARYLAGGRVAFHVDRAADIRQVLAFARRQGLRPVIVGGAQAWQVAGELAQAKVPVVLDPLVDLPGSFDMIGATLQNASRLTRAGVRVAFTNTSDGTHNARKVRQGAGIAVANGLPWEAALAGLTANPAEIFGLGAQFGRIAPGYVADLVLWSGDPLEVTTVAQQVWIDGRAQPMRSRQTELRDRYRPKAASAN